MGDLAAPGRQPRKMRLLGALTGAGLVVAAIAGYMLVHHFGGSARDAVRSQPVSGKVPPMVSAAGLAQRSGVRITHVAITGNGGLVDLRYQVVDADKAAVIHEVSPELVDETTGAVVNQLFMGHQHKGLLRAGQTYYLIFQNPGNLVQRGTRVTVELGGRRVPHVTVQ